MCEKAIIWQICFHLTHKHKLLILSPMNDLMTFSACFNIKSKGSISQLCNTVER